MANIAQSVGLKPFSRRVIVGAVAVTALGVAAAVRMTGWGGALEAARRAIPVHAGHMPSSTVGPITVAPPAPSEPIQMAPVQISTTPTSGPAFDVEVIV